MAAFTSLLGDSLVGKSGAVDTASALRGKVVGLYFSAHWCPPCRGFTPQLAESYVALTSGGKNFEIVFVSSDRDQHSFDEYYTSMPWLALPFAERDRKAQLSSAFKVSGIPCLVILDENAKEITRDGRTAIIDDPSGAKFPWHPPSLWELLGANVHRNSREAVALRSRVFALFFSAAMWLIVVAVAIMLRVATATSPHSGEGFPPLFGDYEAQRHWMEITVNLDVASWYAELCQVQCILIPIPIPCKGTSIPSKTTSCIGVWTTHL
jgi:thiol-disulfide isomerase/thioredoxin